jgi:hypothetical protein
LNRKDRTDLPRLQVCGTRWRKKLLPLPCTAHLLVCRHDTDHVTRDEHLNHNCSFSKARNSSLMMVPAWTEICRSNCWNFNCFNISVISYMCASSWKNKEYFDAIDVRYKHEDYTIAKCKNLMWHDYPRREISGIMFTNLHFFSDLS